VLTLKDIRFGDTVQTAKLRRGNDEDVEEYTCEEGVWRRTGISGNTCFEIVIDA
jgi:hypothetical protein